MSLTNDPILIASYANFKKLSEADYELTNHICNNVIFTGIFSS